jgi:hypothetical protein
MALQALTSPENAARRLLADIKRAGGKPDIIQANIDAHLGPILAKDDVNVKTGLQVDQFVTTNAAHLMPHFSTLRTKTQNEILKTAKVISGQLQGALKNASFTGRLRLETKNEVEEVLGDVSNSRAQALKTAFTSELEAEADDWSDAAQEAVAIDFLAQAIIAAGSIKPKIVGSSYTGILAKAALLTGVAALGAGISYAANKYFG